MAPARAADTSFGPGNKREEEEVDESARILALPTGATYFVACFICAIKRYPICPSYLSSGDFRPDGIFHQTFTLAHFCAADRISHGTIKLFYARAVRVSFFFLRYFALIGNLFIVLHTV